MNLRDYLTLGVIIGTLPNQIVNGTLIDATPVMNDFNYIVNQVNANVPALIPVNTAITAFTPLLDFGGVTTGITYLRQVGNYVRIGNVLFFNIDIALTSKGAAAGDTNIHGLPFTINAAWASAPILVWSTAVTYADSLIGYCEPGLTSITLVNLAHGGTATIVQNTAIANNSEIAMAGFYVI